MGEESCRVAGFRPVILGSNVTGDASGNHPSGGARPAADGGRYRPGGPRASDDSGSRTEGKPARRYGGWDHRANQRRSFSNYARRIRDYGSGLARDVGYSNL